MKKQVETKYFLGVDYGEAKVGLAIANSETRIAFAYGLILNDKNFLKNFLAVVEKEKICKIIIGIPSRINRDEVIYGGEKLGEYLKEQKELDVEYQNEMFSTKIARDKLREKGVRNLDRFDDEEAARIILDDWLAKNKF